MTSNIVPLERLGLSDLDLVGGKNASLGEMIANLSAAGVNVPGGFAITAQAFREFLAGGLGERIHDLLDTLDVEDIEALSKAGSTVRQWVIDTPLPEGFCREIEEAYLGLEDAVSGDNRVSESKGALSVAVRSSATAEDLPEASFAGQQDTYLNVFGIEAVLRAVHDVYASLFSDRAIAYRVHHGFAHRDVMLSVGVQRMVRADLGSSGVMFTLDTESGFRDVVFITSAYGLGETIVQGAVNPDEFYVYKPALRAGRPAILRRTLGSKMIKLVYDDRADGSGDTVKTVDVPEEDRQRFSLTDDEVLELARQALLIEDHYGRPMDIEWAKDGSDGRLRILQARPETVKSRTGKVIEQYTLKGKGKILAEGRSIGGRIGSGSARVLDSVRDIGRFRSGDILVTDMTDPDWEPILTRAAAVVTDRGGRTCHAAIIARELGIPAVVGCNEATKGIKDGASVTVSCAEGDTGYVYEGALDFERGTLEVEILPEIPVKIMLNVGNPDRAFDFAAIPNHGVGLARLEFIINRMIGVHPLALLEFDSLPVELKAEIHTLMAGYDDPVGFYVEKLTEGISTIAAAFAPEPVIVRLSDFKSNEYANLLGGQRYEPHEENPMLGFRGASRYVADSFRPAFELECQALKRVREQIGLENVWVMVPFVRTVSEAEAVVKLLKENGLERGQNGLHLIMMCELPSNAILADEFLAHFDGMSIGSNDMTQLTLGLDRDSSFIAETFDERDDAVKVMLSMAIAACTKAGKYIGICGQGPSDHPELAQWLLGEGIESMSLNPDTVVETWLSLAGEDT